MSNEKPPHGNITVRLEREFLTRLENLESYSGLNRSDITRQSLDAAIRQFERTGKLSFPFEIADVAIHEHRKIVELCGELKGRLGAMEEKADKLEAMEIRAHVEVIRMRENLVVEREKAVSLERLTKEQEARIAAYSAELAEASRREGNIMQRMHDMENHIAKLQQKLRELEGKD